MPDDNDIKTELVYIVKVYMSNGDILKYHPSNTTQLMAHQIQADLEDKNNVLRIIFKLKPADDHDEGISLIPVRNILRVTCGYEELKQ